MLPNNNYLSKMDHILIKKMFPSNIKKMIQDDFPDLDVISLRYEDYSKSSCQILNPKNIDGFWENVLRRPGSIIVSKLKTNKIEITDGILVYPFNKKSDIINALYTFFPETKVPKLLSDDWNVTLVMCDDYGNVVLQTRPTETLLEFPFFNNVNKTEFKNVIINCDRFPLDYQNTKFLRLQPNTNNFLAVCEASVGMINHIMTTLEPHLLPFLQFYRNMPSSRSQSMMSSSSLFIIETYLSVEGSLLSEIKI
jgi:hypothetical protein